jgi:hypothetical protein
VNARQRRRIGGPAALLALATLSACAGPETIAIDALAAPPGTLRAVFFEVRARCHRNLLRLSAVAPAVACTSAIVGAGTIAPAADGSLRLGRRLEIEPAGGARRGSVVPWTEQTFELVAYGPWGSAVFANRSRRFAAWRPEGGPPALAFDPRARHDFVPAPERAAFALEPLGGAIHNLFEVPPRLRAALGPFVDDAARLLDARLADPALSPDARQMIEMHRLRLADALRFWAATPR